MEPKLLILATAYFSCLVLSVWSAPVSNVAAVGAAVGAVKQAIKDAAISSARSIFTKHINAVVKGAVDFLRNKALSALSSKGALLKEAVLAAKQAAAKAAVQGAVFGTGAALGAAVVAHKPYFVMHEDTLVKPHNVPPLLDAFPWLYNLLHPKNAAFGEPVSTVTYEFPDDYQEASTQRFFYPQQHFESIHR